MKAEEELQYQRSIQTYQNMITELQEQIQFQQTSSQQVEIQATLESIQEQIKILQTKQTNLKAICSDTPVPNISKEKFSIKQIVIVGSILLSSITIGSLLLKSILSNNPNGINTSSNIAQISNLSEVEKSNIDRVNIKSNINNETQPVEPPKEVKNEPNLVKSTMPKSLSQEATPMEHTIKVHEAIKYIGKETTVCGNVAQVKPFNKGTYLNFTHPFPNHNFTAVIWRSDSANIRNPESYLGHSICIYGQISSYKGKAQIIIKSQQQIKNS